MTKKSISIKILSVFFVIVSVISMFSTVASAATCSSGKSTRTITVVTKANWLIPGSESITLSQTKGVRTEKNYNPFTGKTTTKTRKCYGDWKIVATATDGSHTVKKTLSDGSLKIALKANKTYKITVTWDSTADTIDSVDKGSFTTLPTWKVKSTYKVSNYY